MKKYMIMALVLIMFQQDVSCSNSHAKLNKAIQQDLISARNVMNSNVKLELDSLLPALLTDVATGKMSKSVAIAKIKAIKTSLERYKSEHTTWSWWFGSTPEIVKDYINPALAKVDVALKALNASTTNYSFLIGGTSILAVAAIVLGGVAYIIKNHPQILGIAVVENEVPVRATRTDTYEAAEIRRKAAIVHQAQEVAAGIDPDALPPHMEVSPAPAARRDDEVRARGQLEAREEAEVNAYWNAVDSAAVDARAAGVDEPVEADREALFSRSAAAAQASRRNSDSSSLSEDDNSSVTSAPVLIGEDSSSVSSVSSSAAARNLRYSLAASIASPWFYTPSSSAVRRAEPARVDDLRLTPQQYEALRLTPQQYKALRRASQQKEEVRMQ